jgi:hypothetical protein
MPVWLRIALAILLATIVIGGVVRGVSNDKKIDEERAKYDVR